MSKQEAIEVFAKEVYNGKQTFSYNDFVALVNSADSQQERDFYAHIYNYLLGQKAREAIQNGVY